MPDPPPPPIIDDAAVNAMIAEMDEMRRRQQQQSFDLQAKLGLFAGSELETLCRPTSADVACADGQPRQTGAAPIIGSSSNSLPPRPVQTSPPPPVPTG